MLKKTITYTDYDGQSVTEDFYFNLSKAELTEMQMSKQGGYEKWARNMIDHKDYNTMYTELKKIILGAYGVKSEDGRRFVKNQTLREEFEQTEAFSELIMELLSDHEKAEAFMVGVLPADVGKKAMDQMKNPNAPIHPALKG